MTHLSIRGLTKRYAGQESAAIDGLSLEIESGSLVALLGPSGCGKTTTMKMIAGLLEPTSGDILFGNKSILDIAPERRGAVMVFQNYLLFPYMSIAQNVGYGLKMRKIDQATIDRRVGEMLELVKLPGLGERRPKELSGGQQQRIALARALIVKPNLLLLDEPLSNLDAHLRFEMRDLIREIQQEMGITTLFVTHDQEEAAVLSDKIALILHGKLQQYDAPMSFYDAPTSREIADFFGGVNFLPGSKTDGRFTCDLGTFAAPRGITSGNGIATIRPEDIRIADSDGENVVTGTVASHVYVGTHSRLKVQVGNYLIHVITDADVIKTYGDGAQIRLQFPSHKIWVLPPETE
ncbi:MAG: ABC-type Fe3+/spermidine/putrescine transport system ATPase subunit [Sulfitobacter sp.]|jgi:ABC-type Fe3+/spermidine/putrescine transport system ATPase subunit